MRTCSACGKPKPDNEFPVASKVRSDGRASKCSDCANAASRVHYSQRKLATRPRAEFQPRPCSLCDVVYDRDGFRVNNRCRDGYERRCRKCHQAKANAARKLRVERLGGWTLLYDPVKQLESGRRWRANNREKTLAVQRKSKYGLTPEMYEAMLGEQSGRCAICADVMTSPHVDHCHVTGAIRGLLCGHCNKALGLLRDSPDLAMGAAHYLLRNTDVFAMGA